MRSRGCSEQKRDYLRYAESDEAKVRVEVFFKKRHTYAHRRESRCHVAPAGARQLLVGSVGGIGEGGADSGREVMCPLDNCIYSSAAARVALDGQRDGGGGGERLLHKTRKKKNYKKKLKKSQNHWRKRKIAENNLKDPSRWRFDRMEDILARKQEVVYPLQNVVAGACFTPPHQRAKEDQ